MPLPLRLNIFERYMWADDRPTSPMSFFVRVLFSGRFDMPAFASALETALQRHPFLHARITGRRIHDLSWVLSPNLLPWIDCANEGVPMLFPGGFRIDLRMENGLRIWIRHNDKRGEIRFQFHHACCDGVAANQFIADVLCAYDWKRCEPTDAGPALRPLDFEGLSRRHRLTARPRSRLLHVLVTAWGAFIRLPLFFLTRPVPLHASGKTHDPGIEAHDTAVPELLTWHFSKMQLGSLLAMAKRSGATLNDLMLRDLFLAMQAWNHHHGEKENQFLRILVPFNLREPEHNRLPATNVMGMINIDRRFNRTSLLNPQILLESIRNETRFLKTTRLPATFMNAMAVSEKVMGSLERVFRTNRCLTTAVLSNLGRIFGDTPLPNHDGKLLAGGLVVEAIDTAPPVRTGSGISCTIYTYANRLSLTMLYDQRGFSLSTAKKLLDHIVNRMEQTITRASNETSDSVDACCHKSIS